MTTKTYKGTGGLWLRDNFKASDTAARWKGSFTCTCGRKNDLVGFGRDQQRSQSDRAPTIQLKVNRDG
jgi:hypothetical protein